MNYMRTVTEENFKKIKERIQSRWQIENSVDTVIREAWKQGYSDAWQEIDAERQAIIAKKKCLEIKK